MSEPPEYRIGYVWCELCSEYIPDEWVDHAEQHAKRQAATEIELRTKLVLAFAAGYGAGVISAVVIFLLL